MNSNQHSMDEDFATLRLADSTHGNWSLTPDESVAVASVPAILDRLEEQLATTETERDDFEASQARLLEQFDALHNRVGDELRQLERWAGEQNAGNAFAEQVRYWALSHLERLSKASSPASKPDVSEREGLEQLRADADHRLLSRSETSDPAKRPA